MAAKFLIFLSHLTGKTAMVTVVVVKIWETEVEVHITEVKMSVTKVEVAVLRFR